MNPLASPFMALPIISLSLMQWSVGSEFVQFTLAHGAYLQEKKLGPWYDMKPRRLRTVHVKEALTCADDAKIKDLALTGLVDNFGL